MSISRSSTWLDQKPNNAYPKLTTDVKADVVVIGGGITGVTCSYLLSQHGMHVVLVEKDTIASGVTGYTTAMITQYIDVDVQKLIDLWGKETAVKIWESHGNAIETIEHIVKEEKINCEFIRVPYFIYAQDNAQKKDLEKEHHALETLGAKMTIDDPALFPRALPHFAIPNQAKFHPVKYVSALAKAAQENGVQIFEQTEVINIDRSKYIVQTKKHKVHAKHIIIATYFPEHSPKTLAIKKGTYTTYVLAAEIDKGLLPEIMAQDLNNPYHYFRVDKRKDHDRIIIGGEDHRSQIPGLEEKSFKALKEYLEDLLHPLHAAPRITHQWSGPIIETADGLAYIGPMDIDYTVYYATGFSGNGMTYGTIAGKIITDLICGKKNEYSDLYKAERKPTPSQLWNKVSDYAEELVGGAIKNISK